MKLAKVKERVDAMRKSALARNAKAAARAGMRPLVCYGAGYGIGALEKSGKTLPNLLANVSPTLGALVNEKGQFAILAWAAAKKSSGDMRDYLNDASASLSAIAGYQAGRG